MKTRTISEVINELAELSESSTKNSKHYHRLTKYMRFGDYDAAYHMAEAGARGFLFRDAYQQKLSELKAFIKPLSAEEKQQSVADLLLAIKNGNVVDVIARLESGSMAIVNEKLLSNLNEEIKEGETALGLAIKLCRRGVISVLLKYGAQLDNDFPVNLPLTRDGDTPLHFACTYGISELVVQAIDCGADVNARNTYHMTPLFIACAQNQQAIARLLLNKGADPNIGMVGKGGGEDITPFNVVMNDFKMARDLIECGYNYHDDELVVAKTLNDELYDYMKQPLRDRKKEIIAKGSAEHMMDELQLSEDIRPILSSLYIENADLKRLFCKGLDYVFNHENKLLLPLLKLVIKATSGELLGRDGITKSLKIVVVDSKDIHCVTAGDDEGVYKGKNTVYVAGGGDPQVAFSTMLHEFKHYADMQVYGDMDKPYRNGHQQHFEQIKQHLSEIAASISVLSDADLKEKYSDLDIRAYESIISIFEDYKPKDQNAEIMVKVPEVIGMFGVDVGYKWLEENEKALLKFYEIKFNRSCEMFLKENQQLNLGPDMSPNPVRKG